MRYGYPTTVDPQALYAWASRLIDDLNRTDFAIDALPVFADDATAATGNVRVGQGYVTHDGIVRRRLA